jgi:hypothetical protein
MNGMEDEEEAGTVGSECEIEDGKYEDNEAETNHWNGEERDNGEV